MSLRTLTLITCLCTLAALRAQAADVDAFLRETFRSATIRLPNVTASSCTILPLRANSLVVVVHDVALETRSLHPRGDWVRSIRILGPDVLGGTESRITVEAASTIVATRLKEGRLGTYVVLDAVPSAEEPAEGASTGEGSTTMAPAPRDESGDGAPARRTRARGSPGSPSPDVGEPPSAPSQAESQAAAHPESGSEIEKDSPKGSSGSAGATGPAGAQRSEATTGSRQGRSSPAAARERSIAGRSTGRPAGSATEAASAAKLTPTPEIATVRETDDGMVQVPAGDVLMGTAFGMGFADESPQHVVHVGAFDVDRTEVTVGDFERSPFGLPRQPAWNQDSTQPVVDVTWHEASEYCESLGKRLPTEAEWERAARGSDGRPYPWGNAWKRARVNSAVEQDGFDHAAPADSFAEGASPWGAVNMAGNVWEWVADWYGQDYYRRSPSRDPRGPERGTERVARGGSFLGEHAFNVRASVRMPLKASARRDDVGFRCAR